MCEDAHGHILRVLRLTKQDSHSALLEINTRAQSSKIIKVRIIKIRWQNNKSKMAKLQ